MEESDQAMRHLKAQITQLRQELARREEASQEVRIALRSAQEEAEEQRLREREQHQRSLNKVESVARLQIESQEQDHKVRVLKFEQGAQEMMGQEQARWQRTLRLSEEEEQQVRLQRDEALQRAQEGQTEARALQAELGRNLSSKTKFTQIVKRMRNEVVKHEEAEEENVELKKQIQQMAQRLRNEKDRHDEKMALLREELEDRLAAAASAK